jgi:group II intron reverse transcriptase/maturase
MVSKILTRLKTLKHINENNNSIVNKDLFRLLCKKELLIISYNSIKSNPGNMTPGTDEFTFDGFSENVIDKIIQDLKDGTFTFKPVRRIHIPKNQPGKFRPLGIPSPRDKVVQKAMLLIMESVYDPTFSKNSHGFRSGKSCHTALKEIRQQWQGVSWAIEGDITGCYDNVDHHILINILRKKIQDERFIHLIWKLLRSGIIEKGQEKPTYLGTPQGSILSPILANIYLNEFDKYVEFIIEKLNSKTIRKRNPYYKRVSSKIYKLRKQTNKIKENKNLIKILSQDQKIIPSRDPLDTNYKKIRYIRYADDWLIGIIGDKNLVKDIKSLIENFLLEELKLTLSIEKTHITHLYSRKVEFLGFEIEINNKSTFSASEGKKNRISIGWQPKLLIPTRKLISSLSSKNFCSKLGKGKCKKGWILYPDETITERYNYIIRGLRNYYSPADNYNTSMKRIEYILRYSWAHTLAAKHRTRISKQLIRDKKLGLDLTEIWKKNIWDFKPRIEPLDDRLLKSYTNQA